jgi:ROK family
VTQALPGLQVRFPWQIHKEVNMIRRSLLLVIAVGLATLGSSIAWSEDSDQAALIKALGGAKLTLLQGIAQVAKGTEVPIEAKYEMAHGKLMLSIYTSSAERALKSLMRSSPLIKGAESGNIATQECRDVFQDRLARASLAAVINILDPDVIVLGGGLSCSS